MIQQRGKMNPQKNLHRRSCKLQVSQHAADNDTEALHSQCSQHRPAMVLLFLKHSESTDNKRPSLTRSSCSCSLYALPDPCMPSQEDVPNCGRVAVRT